jgi:arylsulfatase A-like enzyme
MGPRHVGAVARRRRLRKPVVNRQIGSQSIADPALQERTARAVRVAWMAVSLLLGSLACQPEASTPQPLPPNIIWIIWDTVRASNMSVYGYDRTTTPHLDEWARRARVFDNVLSTASTTIPSHASMFTGMLPAQHGVDDGHPKLGEQHHTIAEILKGAGYRTYLFSANPYVGKSTALSQGFDTVEHPWSPAFRDDANRIIAEKTAPYTNGGSQPPSWARYVKTAGAMAEKGLTGWIEQPGDEPFFAVVNYMEAHLPLVPDRRFRERFMTNSELEQSYTLPVLGMNVWRYTTGLMELDASRLEVLRHTYDAAIAELDHLLFELLGSLERSGKLADTVVVLTSDHGELLGEHHMLNHQYSVHEPLLRVPLIISHPTLVEPGRDSRPAMNIDLFPTLLELAGVAVETPFRSEAVSLIAQPKERLRLSEYPFADRKHIRYLEFDHPDFDPDPWLRSLRALRSGTMKYVWASDGRHALYDLTADPEEQTNLVRDRPRLAEQLDAQLRGFLGNLGEAGRGSTAEFSDETRAMLESLGY